jgi:hypothetical protein
MNDGRFCLFVSLLFLFLSFGVWQKESAFPLKEGCLGIQRTQKDVKREILCHLLCVFSELPHRGFKGHWQCPLEAHHQQSQDCCHHVSDVKSAQMFRDHDLLLHAMST